MMHRFHPEAVRRLLQDRQWSINALARQLDLEPVRVRGWLNGRHQPSPASISRLAAALDVAPDQLLIAIEQPGPGAQGAVPLSSDQVLVMMVIMRLVQDDPHQVAQALLDKLPWKHRDALLRERVLPAGWEALWHRLQAKIPPASIWETYRIQVQVVPPPRMRPLNPPKPPADD